MPHADTNGQRIWFRDSGGSGLPLVLAHGWLMDADMFAPQEAALGSRHRVITWDGRGHGRTESTAEPFTYWDSADDLRGVLDHLGIERAVVGGMSQGGFVALRFALRYPERTAGLVLIDTRSGPEDAEKVAEYDVMHDVWVTDGPSDQLAEMVAAIIIGGDGSQSAEWIAKWQARPKESVTQIYRTLMDRDDVTSRLAEITAPTLVIHGDADAAIHLSNAEALCRALQGCSKVVVIGGAGHSSNLTHPDPANRAIEEFLARLA